MKTVIVIVAGASAAAFLSPARAQTISQPSGCIAGVPCQAATLAIGGASLGGNALAVTGASIFTGSLQIAFGNVRLSTDAGTFTIGIANDVILSRKGAGIMQHGDADTAFPVAQTITAQSVSAGTPNTAAPNLTIDAPKGTGTGPGGSFIVRVAPAGTAGSAQNAMTTALTIDSTKTATFANTISGTAGGVTFPGNFTSSSGQMIASAGLVPSGGRSVITSSGDGFIGLTNNALTGFTALNFGPNTSSFPRLAVSSNGLIMQNGDGSANTQLTAGSFAGDAIKTTPKTVGTLITCNAGADGNRQFVTDATTTAFAAAVTGGGSNHVPVYCDGSGTPTWKIG